MKKIIAMILTLAIAISGIIVPADKANAEEVTSAEVTPAAETPSVEATTAPVQTEGPEEEYEGEKPEKSEITAKVNIYSYKDYSNGDTAPVTKGFTESFRLYDYKNSNKNVKWTSSNPKIVAIQTKPVISGKKYCVVKGKKYGKATLTAEYEGQTTEITIKVVKNQYVCKIKDLEKFGGFDGMKGKKTGSGLEGVTSAKLNKSGNLIVKYYKEYTKWTKFGKKNEYRSIPSFNNEINIEVKNEKGKQVVKYKKKTGDGKTLSVQHPKKSGTVAIPKKYVKGKNIDLRKCDYTYWSCGDVNCSDVAKARR